VHEAFGGAFPKRHHVDCGVIAIIFKVPDLGHYNSPFSLSIFLLSRELLVYYKVLLHYVKILM
jgi:hypothetical protein